MSETVKTVAESRVKDVARRAKAASRLLAGLPGARRNEVLYAAADEIEARRDEIISANEIDCRMAAREVEQGSMPRALFERLQTSERGIRQMTAGVRQVAALEDPLGRELAVTELDDRLTLYKVSCPLGVVGVIFEARPDVISQVSALALKSGNALLLKGGAEAVRTNETLISIWRDALSHFPDVPVDALNLLYTRADVGEMLTCYQEIDLIIPRGSSELVRYISEHSRIPVLGHGEGVCHIYVDRAADLRKALEVTIDAKTQYPAACNAAETLLVHEEAASEFLPEMVARLQGANVEVRGCARTVELARSPGILPASEEDWRTEYSDLIISIKVVASCAEAIEHINTFGSRHTEAIMTEDAGTAALFMESIDAASVFHNASTRFADGFRYGLGAELGISNGKLHARGPVGLEGLTTYKYKLIGDGHTVATYGKGARSFKHKRLK